MVFLHPRWFIFSPSSTSNQLAAQANKHPDNSSILLILFITQYNQTNIPDNSSSILLILFIMSSDGNSMQGVMHHEMTKAEFLAILDEKLAPIHEVLKSIQAQLNALSHRQESFA